MQWTLENVQSVTDVKDVGDFLGKTLKGSSVSAEVFVNVYRYWKNFNSPVLSSSLYTAGTLRTISSNASGR